MQELASGYGLIEGPVWDDKRGLIFSDVINGGVLNSFNLYLKFFEIISR